MENKEENKVFELRLDWKSLDRKEQVEYIDSLHDYIVNWEASSIKQMILALDDTALKITEDLRMINAGTAYTVPFTKVDTDGTKIEFPSMCNLKVLNDDKDSKTYDRVMALVTKMKDFKAVCEMAEDIRPQIKHEKNEKEVPVIDIGENAFESIQEKHYNQRKGK